jgi:hypothetical protein
MGGGGGGEEILEKIIESLTLSGNILFSSKNLQN